MTHSFPPRRSSDLQFPSREIAQRSYDYRTLGLGFANIGGLLMSLGLGYDSAEGRAIAGAISAIMTGVSYATSAETIGRGPGRGGVCQYGWICVVVVSLEKTN